MQLGNRIEAAGALNITRLQPLTDGLQISWSDGHASFFHALWLRDCCYCTSCGDSYSSKRFVLPHLIALDVQIDTAEISAQGELLIRWQGDAHESRYDPHWLRQNCYDDEARAARFHEPLLWDSAIADSIPSLVFAAARDDELQRLDLYRKLRDYGFVVVKQGPGERGGIEAVAKLVGDLGDAAYGKIFDLSPSSSVKTMGNTQRAVPPHTDEAFRYSPPGINLLSCVRPAASGGESILVDGFYIAERLRKQNKAAFDLLCRHGQTFNRIHAGTLDQRSRQCMIALDDRDAVIGIRVHTRSSGPMDLPVGLVKPYYAAHRAFCELMMAPQNQLQFQLQAGDSIIFDNHRVMHARSEFQDPQRFLQLCNVSREGYHERLRLLAAKLGYQDEANMVLPAGMTR